MILPVKCFGVVLMVVGNMNREVIGKPPNFLRFPFVAAPHDLIACQNKIKPTYETVLGPLL